MKIYRQIIFNCDCGSTVKKYKKARHEQSIKHQTFMNNKK